MADKRETAQAFFREGYNCAQAVLLAFSDELDLAPDVAARLASSFGGGLAKLREVCGTVSAMAMIAGLRDGYLDPAAEGEKAAHYARVQALVGRFREKNGSILCRELLAGLAAEAGGAPENRSEAYYAARPCARLVGDAAQIMEEYLQA